MGDARLVIIYSCSGGETDLQRSLKAIWRLLSLSGSDELRRSNVHVRLRRFQDGSGRAPGEKPARSGGAVELCGATVQTMEASGCEARFSRGHEIESVQRASRQPPGRSGPPRRPASRFREACYGQESPVDPEEASSRADQRAG